MNSSAVQPDAAVPVVILCVDDEPNILSSLQRLLRRQGYQVLSAQSGADGLAILEQQPVDLVISDMRMPQMDGARFLEQVRQRWPDTTRVLLTGYADVESTMAAINKGEIYRYIAKPWDDNDVILLVKHVLERQALEREKRRLEVLTQQQNEELKTLNASLEAKVQERTRELQLALQGVQRSNEQLRKNFLTSVSIFSNLMELRAGSIGGHSRRVAEIARKLASRMGLLKDDLQDVVLAALLHDIGKIGLPDSVLDKAEPALKNDELVQLMRHPLIAETALMPLDQLKVAATLIRSHHEHFDGSGYPERLSGTAIPLGARILLLANDYDAVQHGHKLSSPLSQAQAYEFIVASSGKHYDPAVVEAFKALFGGNRPSAQAVEEPAARTPKPGVVRPRSMITRDEAYADTPSHEEAELELTSKQLRPGMVLSKGVITREGLLLLFRDDVLDDKLIAQVIKFEKQEKYPLTFWVKEHARWGAT
ncbi:MAG TPA: HD domain-containing phosphohydrolase [Sideroxyarcus sp.]|nr:HD domain-containing phosphohydrolase [Sideroxyarcus sp.]